MEEDYPSETLVEFQRTTWHYVSKNRAVYIHSSENLNSFFTEYRNLLEHLGSICNTNQ
jgi:hypothetical protein